MITLRPHQARDKARIRRAFGAARSVLYRLPTGGGKTVTFSSIAADVAERGGCVLVVAHRRELIAQAVETLGRFGLAVGVVCSGWREPAIGVRVIVGSVQTIVVRGLPSWFVPSMVIADETHLAASRTWRYVLTTLCADAWRLGVTATPERLDGQALGDLFETMVEGPEIVELQALGLLCPCVTYSTSDAPPVPVDTTERAAAGMMATTKITGDIVAAYLRRCRGRTGLVFASSIAHGEQIAAAFVAAGVAAEVLTGRTSSGDRAAILARLKSGETPIVVNYGVLTEGFDEPSISYIGVARCTMSLALWLQMCGRGLRIHPGKVDCIIHDHGGNGELRFGPVELARSWSLDGKRSRSVASADAALAVATCGECLALYARREHQSCPRCGAEPAPVERRLPANVVGRLERLDAAAFERRQRDKSRATPPRPAPSWADVALWDRYEAERQENGYLLTWTAARVRHGVRRRNRWR
jgi:superfamily II DNA or RNA helicase